MTRHEVGTHHITSGQCLSTSSMQPLVAKGLMRQDSKRTWVRNPRLKAPTEPHGRHIPLNALCSHQEAIRVTGDTFEGAVDQCCRRLGPGGGTGMLAPTWSRYLVDTEREIAALFAWREHRECFTGPRLVQWAGIRPNDDVEMKRPRVTLITPTFLHSDVSPTITTTHRPPLNVEPGGSARLNQALSLTPDNNSEWTFSEQRKELFGVDLPASRLQLAAASDAPNLGKRRRVLTGTIQPWLW
ncbi:hypothetical protein C8F01DRAFT_1233995 [Mycena amicta]|nr:hypothetical protein C8F01DRAFT_1233995 [Mycena amicta]